MFLMSAVDAHEITTKAEAAEISDRLLILSKKYKCNTELQLGLLESLYNWNQYQAYGYSTPSKLKSLFVLSVEDITPLEK